MLTHTLSAQEKGKLFAGIKTSKGHHFSFSGGMHYMPTQE